MTILVVDDELQYRLLLRQVLQDDGHMVMEAADGEDALRKISRVVPDLIISDVYMPAMDGLKFHAAIRSDPDRSSIPFLFVSAYDDEHTQGAVKDPRYDGFLRKGRPVTLLQEWIRYLGTPPAKRSGPPPGESRSRTPSE